MATLGSEFDKTLKPHIDAEVKLITTEIVTGINTPLKSDITAVSNSIIKVEVIGGVVIAVLLAALGFLFYEHQKLKKSLTFVVKGMGKPYLVSSNKSK